MKKLTKEQAEYLIAEIKKQDTNAHPATIVTIGFATNAINQCTEKEFPAFDVGDIFVDTNNVLTGVIDVSFSDTPSPDGVNSQTFAEFKEFTAGCQKIVEWIEGQV